MDDERRLTRQRRKTRIMPTIRTNYKNGVAYSHRISKKTVQVLLSPDSRCRFLFWVFYRRIIRSQMDPTRALRHIFSAYCARNTYYSLPIILSSIQIRLAYMAINIYISYIYNYCMLGWQTLPFIFPQKIWIVNNIFFNRLVIKDHSTNRNVLVLLSIEIRLR